MINLLPPEFKEQAVYSRRNAVMVRYLALVVILAIALSGALLAARYYLDKQITASDNRLADKQKTIQHYSGIETQAKSINARVKAIEDIQKSQTHFSLLLSDLAKVTPRGVQIIGISLTGDDKKPVRVQARAVDYKTALSFRDSIALSPRISAADIESVTQSELFVVSVAFAFNPGQAK